MLSVSHSWLSVNTLSVIYTTTTTTMDIHVHCVLLDNYNRQFPRGIPVYTCMHIIILYKYMYVKINVVSIMEIHIVNLQTDFAVIAYYSVCELCGTLFTNTLCYNKKGVVL